METKLALLVVSGNSSMGFTSPAIINLLVNKKSNWLRKIKSVFGK
jgi:hypothetical protein